MVPPLSEADKFKTIFVIFKQFNMMKLGIDWNAAADELGLAPGTVRTRMKAIMKEGGVVTTTTAAKPAGCGKNATAGGARRGRPRKTAKRGASESGDEVTGQGDDEEDQAQEGSASCESGEKNKGGEGKTRGRGAKRRRVDDGDDEDSDNGYAAGYNQDDDFDTYGMTGENEVEDWLSHQVEPGEEETEYAVRDSEKYFDAV